MKEAMPYIVGNSELRRRLCDDILKNTEAHAYILAGPHGSGRHTLALNFAAALACENRDNSSEPLPCLHCPSCRKILEGKSPDVIVVGKTGQSVKIEQIRNLKSDVITLPNDLDDKIYILEDADTMTTAAQNAFLLTLEEPPSYVHFFLLCTKPEKLLETVRSRAPILRTELLPDSLVREHLISNNKTAAMLSRAKPQEFEEILTIAAGSIGRALELCDDKERAPLLKQRTTAADFVGAALKRNSVALVEWILALPQKQDELLPILGSVQNALRDLIALKSSEDSPLVFYTDRESAAQLAYASSTAALFRLSDTVAKTVDGISRNANIRLSLVTMISDI